MSPRRFAARQGRTDANSSIIIKALRRCGASVVDLHAVGGGCPDILASFRGVHYLIEIKTADGALRDSQVAFREACRGPVHVVRSVAEALAVLGILLRE